jgi:hypothetical protein
MQLEMWDAVAKGMGKVHFLAFSIVSIPIADLRRRLEGMPAGKTSRTARGGCVDGATAIVEGQNQPLEACQLPSKVVSVASERNPRKAEAKGTNVPARYFVQRAAKSSMPRISHGHAVNWSQFCKKLMLPRVVNPG